MFNILINALGVEDSGGLTILKNTIKELSFDSENSYQILVYKGKYINSLIDKSDSYSNINFKTISNHGYIIRIIYENFILPFYVKKNHFKLIYNMTGTGQPLINSPSIVKVQNLLFFSKTLDSIYFKKNLRILWFREVYLKRVIFSFLMRFSRNIEIQSSHVRDELSNFINLKNKTLFIKNDFPINTSIFFKPKNYNFNNEIIFLYVVGPHFWKVHKNIEDFIRAMSALLDSTIKFHIKITLTSEELEHSVHWDKRLNKVTTFLGYVDNKNTLQRLYDDNVVLISTSIIETLGLHVIEAISNGILAIVPNESYSVEVYGGNIFTYNLFNYHSLIETINKMKDYNNTDCQKKIIDNQDYLFHNESEKYLKSYQIFNDVLKKQEQNV
jgi:glycosyltransferase involved in cell wall biosynthesis